MSDQKKYKWTKVGSIVKSKPPYDKNPDGSDRMYVKVDKTITLREGETLNLFTPSEDAPEWVVFNLSRKNSEVQ